MEKILVAYDSGYGATEAAAEIIAETLKERGLIVDLLPIGPEDISGYDALFLGSPIRLGQCTPRIKRFLKKNLTKLTCMRVTFFFTCMSVTNDELEQELPLYVDSSFSDPGKPRARIRLMKNNHTASYYLTHFLKFVPGVTPLGIAFFKGRLNTKKLTPIHRLIMRFAMFSLPEIENGDFLRPGVIESWTNSLFSRVNNQGTVK
jgi:menaquinone-dependent protoporphyrinogen IX oxidase